MFFAAIYLISGACTMIEAERLYNPEYFAFRRLYKRFRKQAERVAKANAKLTGAALLSTSTTGNWTGKTSAASPLSRTARRLPLRPRTTRGSLWPA